MKFANDANMMPLILLAYSNPCLLQPKYEKTFLLILLTDYQRPWKRTQLWWLSINSQNMATFLPLKHPYTAKEIAKVFAQVLVCLHGYLSTYANSGQSCHWYDT